MPCALAAHGKTISRFRFKLLFPGVAGPDDKRLSIAGVLEDSVDCAPFFRFTPASGDIVSISGVHENH
jgi:hypothetical protein